MGLLSKASNLDNNTSQVLAFSDFINNHSLKLCALLNKNGSNYVVTNSIGFDAASIISAASTTDFWDGICKASGQIYNYSGADKNTLLQLFSFNLKDSISELSVYKSSSSKILLCSGKLSQEAADDFENISDEPHSINVQTLNPLLKRASVFLLFDIDFQEALSSYDHENNKNNLLSFELFEKAISKEIYNRFACNYSISDTTILNNSHSIKTILVTDKTYSLELITNHIILNLRDLLDNFAELLQIDYKGTAASCEQIEEFLQAE